MKKKTKTKEQYFLKLILNKYINNYNIIKKFEN
jgi:hypothetical protein